MMIVKKLNQPWNQELKLKQLKMKKTVDVKKRKKTAKTAKIKSNDFNYKKNQYWC